MDINSLNPSSFSCLLVDVQEKLFKKIDRSQTLELHLLQILRVLQTLRVPLACVEQYPQGLGSTVTSLENVLQVEVPHFEKTTFSCAKDPKLSEYIQKNRDKTWIVFGIETHICVFQTAKDLVDLGAKVMVFEEGCGSRFPIHHERALREMELMGIRVTTLETWVFELLEDAKHPQFKAVSKLFSE